jgi:hypothetical protein
MHGYYYGFDETGQHEIDLILSAVACAGKASHHTEDWHDKIGPCYPPHTGESSVDWIQNAAISAADTIASLRAELAEAREMPVCDPRCAAPQLALERDAALARAEKAEAALRPFANLQIPTRPHGNAGAYSIRHNDIQRAKDALASLTEGEK